MPIPPPMTSWRCSSPEKMPGSTHAEIEAQIAAGAEALGQPIAVANVAQLSRLIGELGRWNVRINLTAIRNPADMVAGHILDSLAVRPLLEGRRVLDIGTGAGFPGLPLAITEAAREFVLLDSNARKISFVRHAIGLLGLQNAVAVEARAEDYAPGDGFDTVIARALASTQKLLDLAGHLLAKDGVLLALKGKHPAAELEEIRDLPGWKYKVLQLTVPGIETRERHVVCLRKADKL
ncbi:MAG: 16S rRNA (guanine(527)-N(7))-methyltransferase RsmG [Woeseiaceae bacterium]|nr:16S rRNA (guanine(527)-N(7))-methyltransferase RsmG [Woeseiaceae bacterium]